MECQGHQAHKARLDDQGSEDHQDHKGHQETRDQMVSLALPGNRDKFVQCHHLRASLVHQVNPAHKDHLGQTDDPGCRDELEHLVRKESMDLTVSQERTVKMDHQENPAETEHQDHVTTVLCPERLQDIEERPPEQLAEHRAQNL